MRGLILYFLLLVLRIPLNLALDIGHERDGFSKTLLEKGLKFVPSKKGDPVALNMGLVLLPAEVDPIPEGQRSKGEALVAHSTCRVEMIFRLSTTTL